MIFVAGAVGVAIASGAALVKTYDALTEIPTHDPDRRYHEIRVREGSEEADFVRSWKYRNRAVSFAKDCADVLGCHLMIVDTRKERVIYERSG